MYYGATKASSQCPPGNILLWRNGCLSYRGRMARHEVAPYVGPQLAEAIGIDAPT